MAVPQSPFYRMDQTATSAAAAAEALGVGARPSLPVDSNPGQQDSTNGVLKKTARNHITDRTRPSDGSPPASPPVTASQLANPLGAPPTAPDSPLADTSMHSAPGDDAVNGDNTNVFNHKHDERPHLAGRENGRTSSVSSGSAGVAQNLQRLPAKLTESFNQSRGVFRATYSGVEVLEIEVNGMAVMRRSRDSALNATQILKLAGHDKFHRTKILEKELQPGYEKVQGGYGKYQGTWAPYDEGVRLCREHGVMDLLEPLLRYDTSDESLQRTPTKDQALAAKRQYSRTSPVFRKAAAAAAAAAGSVSSDMPAPSSSAHPNGNIAEDEIIKESTEPVPPIEPTAANFERSRDIVTELFLNLSEEPNLGDLLASHRDAGEIEIDVPIDDSGHTALHWAAALARIQLVRDLIRHGADPRRANFAGESPLVRAVLVTNSSDLSTFIELLDELYPSLYLTDNLGRTILHHIALTSGIKGRSDASRYYLEAILEWVVRRGFDSKAGRFGFNTFIMTIVNYQDYNGDTALNIAARIGNKHIARQLIEVGADINVVNRAGLRPVDFGVDIQSTVVPQRSEARRGYPLDDGADTSGRPAKRQHLNGTDDKGMVVGRRSATPPDDGATKRTTGFAGPGPRTLSASEKRKEMIDLMTTAIRNLEEGFEREVAGKQVLIDKVHEQLREATSTLNMYKQHSEHLRKLLGNLTQWKRGAQSLENAVQAENEKFRRSEADQGRSIQDYDGEFDPDEPFVVDDRDESKLIPPALLEARISAYRRNQEHLEKFRDELKGRSTELESKFRRVVSLCTSVPEKEVDGVLSGLVQAVESDSGDIDMARVAGFLRKIEA